MPSTCVPSVTVVLHTQLNTTNNNCVITSRPYVIIEVFLLSCLRALQFYCIEKHASARTSHGNCCVQGHDKRAPCSSA